MKRNFFLLFTLQLLLVSWKIPYVKDAIDDNKFTGEIKVNTGMYDFGYGYNYFYWNDEKTIGVFPVNSTSSNSFSKQKPVHCDIGYEKEPEFSFNGTGWGLNKGGNYALYYPFQDKEWTDYKKVPIDMTGQLQNDTSSWAHIVKYDYKFAVTSVPPNNGSVEVNFKNVCAVVGIRVTLPVAGNWTKLTLTSNSKVFITKAMMNVSNGEIIATEKSESISLLLNPLYLRTSTTKHDITLFLALLPTNPGELKVTLTNDYGKEYSTNINGNKLEAGKGYWWHTTTLKSVMHMDKLPSGVEAVDLGLSVRWANMNIGASSVTNKGVLFAWGEVTPHQNKIYNWSNYKWCTKGYTYYEYEMTKYCCDAICGHIDNKYKLVPYDDAAYIKWGVDWRMPSYKEVEELVYNTTCTRTTNYNGTGVSGCIVTSKINGNSIFLPSSFWSSNVFSDNPFSAWYLTFGDKIFLDTDYRYEGHYIRAVCP